MADATQFRNQVEGAVASIRLQTSLLTTLQLKAAAGENGNTVAR